MLGWERWREIGWRYGAGLTEGVVQAAIDAGRIARQPARPLAHLLLGALDEAAPLRRPGAGPGRRSRRGPAAASLLDGLRVRPAVANARATGRGGLGLAPRLAGTAPRSGLLPARESSRRPMQRIALATHALVHGQLGQPVAQPRAVRRAQVEVQLEQRDEHEPP